MKNRDKINYTAYSALFNAVDNCIFVRDDLSNQISSIVGEEHVEDGLGIENKPRLKEFLFEELARMYNKRLETYKLKHYHLNDSSKNKMEIVQLLFNEEYGAYGKYKIYPRTFVCTECGDFRIFKNNDEWMEFDPSKCRKPNCSGHYEQISVLKYCPTCGKIEQIYWKCPVHGTESLQLTGKRDYLNWHIRCTKCDKDVHIIPYPCNHKDPWTKRYVCEHDKSKRNYIPPTEFIPINVKDSHVYSSYVIVTVEVQEKNLKIIINGPEGESDKTDAVIYAMYNEKFNPKCQLSDIQYYLNLLNEFPTEEDQKEAYERRNISPSDFERAKKIKSIVEDMGNEFNRSTLSNINDYLILKEYYKKDTRKRKNKSFNEIIQRQEEYQINKYERIRNKLNIEDITYIPDVHLIASSIGTIKGVNKFYEEEFVPHFEPHWKNKKERDEFKVYSYPFETEGLIFDLNKVKLANWLIDNSSQYDFYFDSEEKAKEFLFNLNEEKNPDEFKLLKTLIHTYSHILIKRSSLFTGLNPDSFGEMLFPNNGSFLLYSTSTINIGGLAHVFENSLIDWFNDVEEDVRNCTFDPFCINDKGACLSCLYLPEFVCTDFNKFLNRATLIGNKDTKGFWDS